ncbi:MAG: hypothetical protein FWF57_05295 [Defluviitaleaceae bacterium]|nr:hypothetical protein [Defluviitaleaceae bacterium]
MKKGRLVGVILIAIIIGSSVGYFLLSRFVPSGTPARVEISPNEMFRVLSQIETEYPQNPYDLMNSFLNVMTFLYSGTVEDEALFSEIIRIQRIFLTDELLERNPFHIQHNNFITNFRLNAENDIFQTDINLLDIEIHENYAIAYVYQDFSNLGRLNWLYFLIYEDTQNIWKIEGYFQSDENFVPFHRPLE